MIFSEIAGSRCWTIVLSEGSSSTERGSSVPSSAIAADSVVIATSSCSLSVESFSRFNESSVPIAATPSLAKIGMRVVPSRFRIWPLLSLLALVAPLVLLSTGGSWPRGSLAATAVAVVGELSTALGSSGVALLLTS